MPTWDESKRRRNIRVHGLDFEGVDAIWDGFTISREDTRERYPEERKRDGDMHVISLRKAERYETR